MLTDAQARILERMLGADLYYSPLKFAMWAYPWGEGNLKGVTGPRKWQRDVMLEIEAYLLDGVGRKAGGESLADFFREAIASGRGPGKSALFGMLAHWFMSTRIGSSTWVAANGEPQLRTKTFPEIAKWVAMGINAEFFATNAMSIQPATWFRNYIESPDGLGRSAQYYYISGQLWSEEKPDAFAGAHNFDGEFALFDEASGIPDPIWTVQEGVFTEDIVDRLWLAFSNPRKNTGAFFECFNKNRDLWRTRQIDARTVEGISHSTYENIIKQHGEDSNEARIEVYGKFPHVGDDQFIGPKLVDEAIGRSRYDDPDAPTIVGVDVARFGSDSTVIAVRKGRDLVSVQRFNGLDTMQVVGKVIEAIGRFDPDLTVVDEGGLGAGVIDRLTEQRYKVRGVNFGSRADNSMYLNKRAEMWGDMKEWLKTASIGYDGPTRQQDNQRLKSDLCGPTYKVNSIGAIVLEAKDAMKKRGLASPDCADALAITFAFPVAARHVVKAIGRRGASVASWLAGRSSSWMN